MNKFIRIFFASILSIFLLTSCIGGKSSGTGIDGGVVELPGENAKFVFNVDAKKANFLVEQVKRVIPEDDSAEAKKSRELLEKFEKSSITVSSLSVFDQGNSDVADIEEPTAMLFSNMDGEVLSFIKDFKEGVKAELDENTKEPNEIFESSESISEFLKKGKEIGKSFKKEIEKSSDEDKKRAMKIVDDMKVAGDNISLLFNLEDREEKLTGLLKDNKGFNEITKNLKGDEFFYVYGAGDAIKDMSSGQPSVGNLELEIDDVLVSISVNKSGVYVNMYYKLKKDITKQQDESSKKQIEAMNGQIKQMAQMYSGFITSSLEEADKKVVNDAINSLNVKYDKISGKSFSMKFSLETDVEKLFGVLEKLSKAK